MGRPKELTEAQRADLRAKGFVPIEIWVPDWDNPEVKARLAEEARLIAESDRNEPDVDEWIAQVGGNVWDDDGS